MTFSVFVMEGFTNSLLMATSVVMEFSKKLKGMLARRRISQDEIAASLGISQGKVSNWVNGKSLPDLYESAQIARHFGVELSYLADDDLDEPPAPVVTEQERLLLVACRKVGIEEVMKLLVPAGTRPTISVPPKDPQTGAPLTHGDRKPRQA